MPTVSELRNVNLVTFTNPILEPLSAPGIFEKKLERFGEHYNVNRESHLYRYLVALCGDAGAGSYRREVLIPKFQARVESTYFSEIDKLFGTSLGLPRLKSELYGFSPETEMLTDEDWQEVFYKDAQYRSRCLTWVRAIIEGPTPLGISLAAEAATGIETDIVENYKIQDNIAGDLTTGFYQYNSTQSRNEFIIVPRAPSITEEERRGIIRLVDKLRPTNTLPTIISGDYLRNEQMVNEVAATSERFYVKRLVTGNPSVAWPDIDLAQGYWIDTNEREAPTFAFMDRQESVTYISITDVESSSEHVGYFNKTQQSLFQHLKDTTDPFKDYVDTRSYSKSIAPTNVTTPWISGQDERATSKILVNNHYPIGYFSQTNTAQFAVTPTEEFWATTEKPVLETDYLILDFGRDRPVNFIDFEICQKPIDFVVEYLVGESTWVAVEPRYDTTFAVDYLPSTDFSWHYFECYFTPVQTSHIRVTFTRRDQRFPTGTSDYFDYSIDLRNLRIMSVITDADYFATDQGEDILGNSFRTELIVKVADDVLDDEITYWQSQPVPTPKAVEALYFDLRDDWQDGDMGYLNDTLISTLDLRDMSNMELYYEEGVVIDEVYIDPLTIGASMKFYYSDDDTPTWDDKLWTPVPRNYFLRKGYHSLPTPTRVKYFKLEFTDLAGSPYQPNEYPLMPDIQYRKYPTWVQNYFEGVYPSELLPSTDIISYSQPVTFDPLALGFIKPEDSILVSYEQDYKSRLNTETNSELKKYIEELVTTTEARTETQDKIEQQIRFNSTVMWQDDLIAQMDGTRSLTRRAQANRDGFVDTGWTSEDPLPLSIPTIFQSTSDLEEARTEKLIPTMWFSRMCRHGYQIVTAPRDYKVAYQVAIRNVKFYRRDYSIESNDPSYWESLDDYVHLERNDFELSDWRYIVGA